MAAWQVLRWIANSSRLVQLVACFIRPTTSAAKMPTYRPGPSGESQATRNKEVFQHLAYDSHLYVIWQHISEKLSQDKFYLAWMNDDRIIKTYFKDVLREYRLKAGMTQEQLAGLVDVSKGFLGMMETGERWPNVDMMIRLAEAMRVRPGEMLDAVVARWKDDV